MSTEIQENGPGSEPRRGLGVRVLIVEDDDAIREAAQDALQELGYDAHAEPNAERALAAIHQHVPAAVIADVRMPGMSGIEFCKRLTGDWPEVPVLLMTAFGDVDMAVDALRAGAFDFIPKPIAFDHLASVLEQAVNRQGASPPMVRLEDPAMPAGSCEGLVGSSDALRGVIERIARVAPTHATVLITGESGTGKELVARAVHDGSPRRERPFVALSCAAMPQGLLEAELFGYRRGAFTGAVQSRDGLFQRADGGTLFLDEIGDLPLPLQPKLLRVLEERRVRPLGSSQEVALDVRIVAATNRDLEHAVRLGHFREDLLFRLNVHHIHLPPLRDRGGDVLELANYFLARGVKRDTSKPESGVSEISSALASDDVEANAELDGDPTAGEPSGTDLAAERPQLAADRTQPAAERPQPVLDRTQAALTQPALDRPQAPLDRPQPAPDREPPGALLSAERHSAEGPSALHPPTATVPSSELDAGGPAPTVLAAPPIPLDEASAAGGTPPFPGITYHLTPDAEDLLRSYRWPGNVRELENALSAAMALAKDGTISVRELPSRLESAGRGSAPPPVEPVSLEEMERRHIEIVLRATGRNKALAARKLGIDRATLYRKLLRLGLSDPQR